MIRTKPELEGINPPPNPWNELDTAFTERMKDEGNWKSFLAERAVYRFRGLPGSWAHRLAQQHYPPPEFSVARMKTGQTPSECGLGAYGVTEITMRDRLIEQLGLQGSARASEFDGKTCSFPAAMDWVAESLGIKVVRHDAPSKLAWSVYEWASSHPTKVTKFYEIYLTRRYKPDKDDDGYVDLTEGLSIGGEDIGVPRQSVVPDALPADSDRPGREPEVEEEDELTGFTIGKPAEAGS